MKAHRLLCVLVLAGLNAGCSYLHFSVRNLVESPLKAVDECCAVRRFTGWAKDAWRHEQKANPEHHFSDDYARGFIDGYVDYLDAGGTGEPPALPPDCYQCSRYETPAGQAAILDWFAGFRHGSSVARASGKRELVVLPIGLPPRHSYGVRLVEATNQSQQPAGPTAPEELLPSPRRVPETPMPPVPDPAARPEVGNRVR
jgi:hypothetical protein